MSTQSPSKSKNLESTSSSSRLDSASSPALLNSIAQRAHYLATQMVFQANNRKNKEKGDPKIGGHASSSSSCLHIMGALHLVVKTGFDHIANKPHASPTDHAYNYLLNLFLKSEKEGLSRFTLEESNQAMMGLRAFSQNGELVFQSYHSAYDPDQHNFFPSGTVGIPPVQAGYTALAYRFAKDHGYEAPDAHFWALCGDSEFREGSLHEAIPDFAERGLSNLTWILDYNRQSLDGHRIINEQQYGGADSLRIERTMKANGWQVIQVPHGRMRLEFFKRPGGGEFQKFLEETLEDYKFQALLLVKDMKALKVGLIKEHPPLKTFLSSISEEELYALLHDLGGHDIPLLIEAMDAAKRETQRPSMIIAHTIKGWGLRCAATPGNHSALPSAEEMEELQKKAGGGQDSLFNRFSNESPEAQFLVHRGEELYKEILAQRDLKLRNQKIFSDLLATYPQFPQTLGINTRVVSYPHTQWMLGQCTAKLTRIANTDEKIKPLTEAEKPWKLPAELMVSMAPDVGTSTNLNPAMDGKIFGARIEIPPDVNLGEKEDKTPDLIPGEDPSDRYIRHEIAEGNAMSCVGAFGRMRDILGVPIIPLMTVYDFFIKRALDQYFYNLYWKSSFICVGTPSGVTLSPEGAQHGWKSDFQIPNQITWEPFYCQELEWILCESIRRHLYNDNGGRTGVLIRGTTRGIEQKDFLSLLKKQSRFQNLQNTNNQNGDELILQQIRDEVLSGAYYLVDHRGSPDYTPGDNVIHIFSMGSLTTEALKASEVLLKKGIYANVIVVTSPDLLCGHLGYENDYSHLRLGLDLKSTSDVYIKDFNSLGALRPGELTTLAGQRVPLVSVHDGEAGLLDNLGSILGVKQIALAVRKHSKCGRPADVYKYHKIDANSVIDACEKALDRTAQESLIQNGIDSMN